MTITLAKVGGLSGNRRLHAVRPGRRSQSRPAVRRARGGRDGDLPRRRRAGDGGDGLRHARRSAGCRKFSAPATPMSCTAKRLLVGHVAIDLLPGPSELLVLADDTANPNSIAADMLAQAEHGSGHERVWLVTTSGQDSQGRRKGNREAIAQTRAARIHPARAAEQRLADSGEVARRRRGAGEPDCAGALRSHDAQRAQGFRRHCDGGRDFPGPLVADGAGRLRGRAEPHAADRRRGRVVCRADRGPIPAPHQRGGIPVAALRRALPAVRQFAALEGLGAHGRSAEIRFER